MTGIGDNSVAKDRLRSYVERIERLNAEVAELKGDIKDIFTEVKAAGFDTKVVRQLIRERRMDAAEREEREALLEVYRNAVGALADTPLGKAGEPR